MIGDRPSETSLTVAAARAAHLIVDREPRIFSDPRVESLLGERADQLMTFHRMFPAHRSLAGIRVEATCRSRYTEDRLAEAIDRGVDQYVVLGAGLDTFAYRSPLASQVRVFEVDHPGTQRWKRRALSRAGITPPDNLTFVSMDFESGWSIDQLASDGLDLRRPAFVSVLGVTVYLTRAAVTETIATVGALPEGTELIADYMLPRELLDRAARGFVDAVLPGAAGSGEPWRSFFTPDDMSALLRRHGFDAVRHVRQREMIDPSLWERRDSLRPTRASVIAHGTRSGRC